jgi:uncharacterized protein YeaO (DUF488 family)
MTRKDLTPYTEEQKAASAEQREFYNTLTGYERELAHNNWHDEIEAALREHFTPEAIALLSAYIGPDHDNDIPPKYAVDYL